MVGTGGLLGRQAEQRAIRAVLDSAAAAGGAALMFRGDVGTGKTALLAWAAAEATGCLVVELAPDRSEAALPLAGMHRLLRALPPSPRIDALLGAVEDGTGDDFRFAMSVAVLDLLGDVARDRPLLCCVDDVQWLDRPTWDVLTFAARRLGGHRIALLFAARDLAAEPADGGAGEWAGGIDVPVGVEVCVLAPLDERSSRELIRDLVPDASVAAAVTAAAGGNPLALRELAGALTPQQRHGEAPAPLTLPAGSRLRREYRARLRALPPATRQLLLIAAIDPELTADELILAAGRAGLDVTALGRAESAGLVGTDSATITFPRAVVRAVVLAEATLAERRSAHALLAGALDPRTRPLRRLMHLAATVCPPNDEVAASLETAAGDSDHAAASRALERAAELSTGRPEAALRLIAAARHAWRGGEPQRARMLLRRARPETGPVRVRARWELLLGEIELWTGQMAAGGERLQAAAASSADRDRHLALAALVRAGDALTLAGDHARFAELAGRALALRGPHDPLDEQYVFEHFAGMSATFRGDHGRAVAALRRSVTLAGTLGGTTAMTRTSLAALVLGDGAEAYRLACRAADVARGRGEAPAVAQALEPAAMARFVMGQLDDTTCLEGLRLARATGQESLVGSQLATLGLLAATIGDRQACLSWVREARALPAVGASGRTRALSEWALAVLHVAGGQYRPAVGRLRGITRPAPRNGHLIIRAAATPYLVEAAVHCGEQAAARRSLAAFDAWTGSTRSSHWLALSARCHALLAGDAADAHDHFEEALRRHDLCPVEFDRARTQLLFGQWLRRHRRPAAAREPLRGALETFERFDARPWAEQARTELRASGETVSPGGPEAAGVLTPHQLQIARLVAEGATNREVAQRLGVSRRTIDHHMRNILAALGARSRIELANLLRQRR